jgi:hypothetical protein
MGMPSTHICRSAIDAANEPGPAPPVLEQIPGRPFLVGASLGRLTAMMAEGTSPGPRRAACRSSQRSGVCSRKPVSWLRRLVLLERRRAKRWHRYCEGPRDSFLESVMPMPSRSAGALAVLLGLGPSLVGCSGRVVDLASVGPRIDDSSDTFVADVAVDADHVYWLADYGVVKRRAKAGGSVEVLADGQDGPYAIAVDDAFVYWANFPYLLDFNDRPGSVVKIPKEGGTPVVLVVDQDQPCAIGIDATTVYYVACSTTKADFDLKKVPKDGGEATVLFSGAFQGDLAVGETSVAVPVEPGVGLVDKATGAVTTIAVDHGTVSAVAFGPGGVYFSGFDVGAVPSGASASTVLLHQGADIAPGGIRADGEHLYYLDVSGVERIPVGGGSVQTVLAGKEENFMDYLTAYGLAIDDTTVYVAANDAVDNVGYVLQRPK